MSIFKSIDDFDAVTFTSTSVNLESFLAQILSLLAATLLMLVVGYLAATLILNTVFNFFKLNIL